MFPYLLKIGSFELRVYSLMLILAVVTGIFFSSRRAKQLGIEPKIVENAVIAVFAGGIIGARLYYVAFNWAYYGTHPGEILAVWHGGLAIHGGIIAGILAALIYCHNKKLTAVKFGDILAPFILIGQGFGRFGNFANGEAHGVPTFTPPDVIFRLKPAFNEFWGATLKTAELKNTPEGVSQLADKLPMTVDLAGKSLELKEYVPWGISFPVRSSQAYMEFGTLAVHPTFFYEMILNFFCAFILLLFWRKDKNIGSGKIFALYLFMYAIIRSFVTFFRADDLMLGPLRAPHVASLVLVVASIFYYFWTKRLGSAK